jgi:restriction endonuclease Mrr
MTMFLNYPERRALRRKARAAVLNALTALGGDARREAIVERALTDGGFTTRELAAAPPEAAGGKYARMVDHDLSWALTNLKRDGLVENPKWGTWRLTNAASPPIATAVEEPASVERLAELREMPYRLYLRTPEWRRTRAAALLRAGNACSLNVAHTDNLEVHHRTYERRGAELVTDLVVLCHACHGLYHEEHGRPRRERSASQSLGIEVGNPAVTSVSQPGKPRKRSLLRRLLAS